MWCWEGVQKMSLSTALVTIAVEATLEADAKEASRRWDLGRRVYRWRYRRYSLKISPHFPQFSFNIQFSTCTNTSAHLQLRSRCTFHFNLYHIPSFFIIHHKSVALCFVIHPVDIPSSPVPQCLCRPHQRPSSQRACHSFCRITTPAMRTYTPAVIAPSPIRPTHA